MAAKLLLLTGVAATLIGAEGAGFLLLPIAIAVGCTIYLLIEKPMTARLRRLVETRAPTATLPAVAST